jgi:hypothetical protein
MLRIIKKNRAAPFLLYWVVVVILYAPAWRAGFVTDAIDWLHDAQTLPLKEYLNRSHSAVHALYQTTQFVTLGFYKLFGVARLPWFLLFVTLQAMGAYMLFFLCYQIFGAANLMQRFEKALIGALIFCVSPYISEVVVWKACYHYLQGLILLLGILICVERYIYTRSLYCPWIAAALFLLSAFSLEIFYLTPLFTATLLFYYRSLGWERAVKRRTWLIFLLPQLIAFAAHLLLFRRMYGEWGSHGTGGAWTMPFLAHLSNGARYAFHLLLFGRYWPQEIKEQVYVLCDKSFFACAVFLFLILPLAAWLIRKTRKGYGRAQAGLLLLVWSALAVLPALPMPFERLFDLSGNRYLYFSVAFGSMLFGMACCAIPYRWLRAGAIGIWIGISVFLTLRTNRRWQTSERINESLFEHFRDANGKTTILLAMPYAYKGIPMINSWPYGNFGRMRETLLNKPPDGKVYDGMAFNMTAPSNGAIAEAVNDSTVKVTLLQWGSWWWYMDFGGRSYETPAYRIDMRDQGHWYEIILKKPLDQYQLLYQVGDKWRVVSR